MDYAKDEFEDLGKTLLFGVCMTAAAAFVIYLIVSTLVQRTIKIQCSGEIIGSYKRVFDENKTDNEKVIWVDGNAPEPRVTYHYKIQITGDVSGMLDKWYKGYRHILAADSPTISNSDVFDFQVSEETFSVALDLPHPIRVHLQPYASEENCKSGCETVKAIEVNDEVIGPLDWWKHL